ncbi:right-handed parallel beta-helix repeat-containing protein [Nocardioides pelophilus]|uniref:right-handed parallel beta-helix repeat-containing protein n=1 Tax=Nocardioides pelophilus TaxID=2172019 RepID=UPI001604768E|nr:right-handed parallel beta-helix repeat-containing protein [Nocardioides pelophilus]
MPNASARVLTVTSAADGGSGSLREAIEQANGAGGESRVEFAIDSGPSTIRLISPLPPVAFAGVIDGWSQPGFDGSPLIELDGSRAGGGGGLDIASDGLTVRGLTVTGWSEDGIRVRGRHCTVEGVRASSNGRYGVLVEEDADDARIVGCLIGTDATGSSARPNQRSGIRAIQAKRCRVGGSSTSERNVLSGNVQYGLEIVGPKAAGAVVLGNLVGCDASGFAAVPNQRTGILVFNSFGATIGGPVVGDGNVISGNGRAGITLDGMYIEPEDYPYVGLGHCHDNSVEGNLIGVDLSGEGPLGNGLRGVLINHAQENSVVGNVISGNGQEGVLVLGPDDDSDPNVVPSDNRILGNLIGATPSGAAVGNARNGVLVMYGARNRIGGDSEADANVISNNGWRGVMFYGVGARTNVLGSHNTIEGNQLGSFHQPAP